MDQTTRRKEKSATPADASSVLPSREELSTPNIGGWLVFPAIGLVLAPVLGVISIISQIAFLSSDRLASLSQEFTGLVPLSYFGLLSTLGLVVYVCYVGVLFQARSKDTPKAMIRFLAVSLGLSILMFGLGLQCFGTDDLVILSLLRSSNIKGAALACAIWIPYFAFSRRVRSTFTLGDEPYVPMLASPSRGPEPADRPEASDIAAGRPTFPKGLVDCPHCSTRVLPMTDGRCPQCRELPELKPSSAKC